MNPDFRALCAELIDALDGWHQAVLETGSGWVRPDEAYLLDRARDALAEPERVTPKSIEERITEADAAIEASMKRIRKIIATPARQLAAEANRSAVPVATPAGPTDEEIIAFWSEHCAGDGDAGIIRLARWGNQPAPPAVSEGREPASVVSEPSDEELLELMPEGFTAPVCAAAAIQANVLSFARAVLARFGHQPAPAAETDAIMALAAIIREVDGNHILGAAALAEAILSHRDNRWGHQPAPPAEGEVAELVAWLRGANWDSKRQTLATRAADLLEQFSSGWVVPTVEQFAPVPVPVAERPTDTQLIEEAIAVGLAFQPQDEVSEVFLPFDAEEPLDELLVNFARAVLARWGHQPAPPAEGEVAELASLIREAVRAWVAWEEGAVMLNNMTEVQLTRAADLLEQRHPAPVPVAERLPGPEDCDGEGRCWLHLPDMGTEPLWRLTDPSMRSRYHSYWLPAHALPMPTDADQPPA